MNQKASLFLCQQCCSGSASLPGGGNYWNNLLPRFSFVLVLAGAVTVFYISLFSPLQFHCTWDVSHVFHRYSVFILEKHFPCALCCSTLSTCRKVLREGKHILAKVLLSRDAGSTQHFQPLPCGGIFVMGLWLPADQISGQGRRLGVVMGLKNQCAATKPSPSVALCWE